MKVLFLDQSGKLGGAELSLLDVAGAFAGSCLVGLFEAGPFEQALAGRDIPVQVLSQTSIKVRKESSFSQSVSSLAQLIPLVLKIARLGQEFDVIYTNTSKALVVGALASLLCRRPLVHHLRDIISADHFSTANRQLLVTLINRFTALTIANSEATKQAAVVEGVRPEKITVIYNGFQPSRYEVEPGIPESIRQQLQLTGKFVVGHFSRLAPWKGQHILIEALTQCPEEVVVLLVGDALFGEHDYVQQLHTQVEQLGLQQRVFFLGFRSDVPALMHTCDLIAHTSTAPEPFGRVIVEAMLCKRPVIAAAAGGAAELIQHNQTGWLCPPGDADKLAQLITHSARANEATAAISRQAYLHALENFNLSSTNQLILKLMDELE